jgi:glycosyltransferase involved in cell wall biosynthesis
MPEVSVIIPTYNRPDLLPRAVESALAAGTNVEVVVVDDASSDETATVCQSLHGIKYVRLPKNQGVAGARNAGVLASSAEYVAFLDDDDVRLPGSLDLQLARLRDAPNAALIYGQALIGGATDGVTNHRYPLQCPSGDVFWRLLTQNFIPSGSAVLKRERLLTAQLFNESISAIDDWDLWIRIAESHPVVSVREPVVVWRRPSPESDQGSASAVRMVKLSTRQFHECWMKLPRVALAQPGMRRQTTRQFSQNMASHLVWESARTLSRGNVIDANRCIVAALRLHSKGIAWRALRQLSTALGGQASSSVSNIRE